MIREDTEEIAHLHDPIVIHTKTDLAPAPAGAFAVSVVADRGVTELLERLDSIVRDHFAAPEGSLVNERQRQAVDACLEGLRAARASLADAFDEQIVLVDLYRASTALGMLTGAISQEEIFDEIFAKFCIGK